MPGHIFYSIFFLFALIQLLSPLFPFFPSSLYRLFSPRGSRKKVLFCDHIFLGDLFWDFLKASTKFFFFLSGQALTNPLPPLSGRATKKLTFFAASLNHIHSFSSEGGGGIYPSFRVSEFQIRLRPLVVMVGGAHLFLSYHLI